MRRYVTETRYKRQDTTLQVVTIYPTAINKKQVKKEMEPSSVLKGMVVKDNDSWRFEGL